MEEKIVEKINNLGPCNNCSDVKIKKFTPIVEFEDYDKLNDDFLRCSCGRRPLDVVMAHILKIMIEEKIVPKKATLRRNTPVPMPAFCYSSLNPQFIGKDDLILIHPDFNEKVAKRLFGEVSEVKGVLKGNPGETIGVLDKNSEPKEYELLDGDSSRMDILRTLIKDKIIISKNQQNSHIEVASTTEEKLLKLYNYLESENIEMDMAIDAMCGSGAIGIFLIKYGFKKVIFNDIDSNAIYNLKNNLSLNEIDSNSYEIFNEPVENLELPPVNLAIVDGFPGVDMDGIVDKLDKVAENILII